MIKKWLRNWLEVPEKVEVPKISDEIKDTIDKLNRELAFWRGWFKDRQPTKKCTKCKENIVLYPFADTAYYISGNRVMHQVCPKDKE